VICKLRAYIYITQLSEGSWELTEELCQFIFLNYEECRKYLMNILHDVDIYLKLKILATYLIKKIMITYSKYFKEMLRQYEKANQFLNITIDQNVSLTKVILAKSAPYEGFISRLC